MVEKESVKGAFHRIEQDARIGAGQKETTSVLTGNDGVMIALASHAAFLQRSRGKSTIPTDYKLVFACYCRLFC